MTDNYNEFKTMLRELLAAYGPTGREEKAAEVLKKYLAPYVDEMYTDPLGNLIGYKKGSSGKKVMLSAHMDQIGMIVLDIDDNGFLRFAPVGGLNPAITVARDVVFENGTRGVTFYETKKDTAATAKLPDMFIDIGCSTREEAEAHVSIGDICVYGSHFLDMGSRAACGAMDDRVCCAIILEALKTMDTEHDLYVVFTTQEEVGCRGGTAAGYSVNPDFSINLDVTLTGDTPEAMRMPMKLGYGPTIKYMDSSAVYTRSIVEFMHSVADKNGIKVQNEILRAGGTDGGPIQRTRGGIAAGCISVATRYVHSPVETVDLGDCIESARFINALFAEGELPV